MAGEGDPAANSSKLRALTGAKPSTSEKGLSDTGTTTATAAKPSGGPIQPITSKWIGDSIVVAHELFTAGLFETIFGNDHLHLRFQPFKKNYVVDEETKTIALAPHFGVLQMDVAYTPLTKPFFWQNLRDTIESQERVWIPVISAVREVPYTILTRREGKVFAAVKKNTVSRGGLAFVAKKLARQVHGDLIPSTDRGGFLSPFEDVSVLYLHATFTVAKHLAHELLGHCYLACRRAPFSHPHSLRGYGIAGSDGKVFEGTVIEFIERHIEANLVKNRAR